MTPVYRAVELFSGRDPPESSQSFKHKRQWPVPLTGLHIRIIVYSTQAVLQFCYIAWKWHEKIYESFCLIRHFYKCTCLVCVCVCVCQFDSKFVPIIIPKDCCNLNGLVDIIVTRPRSNYCHFLRKWNSILSLKRYDETITRSNIFNRNWNLQLIGWCFNTSSLQHSYTQRHLYELCLFCTMFVCVCLRACMSYVCISLSS